MINRSLFRRAKMSIKKKKRIFTKLKKLTNEINYQVSDLEIINMTNSILYSLGIDNKKDIEYSKNYDDEIKEENIKQWKRVEVLKDYRFYIINMNMLAMPWIATGSFVYQSFITSSKGWGQYVIAQSFMSYSVLTVITLLVSGYLVDKFTSRRLLIYMNIPLLLSVLVIIYFNAPITAFVFLGLIGISNGLANLLGSSIWAEIYGVKYIGSIKALTTALMVFATALGTALFGILIDNGFTIEKIAVVSGVYIVLSVLMLFLIRKKLNPINI